MEAKLFDNSESGLLVAQKKATKVFDAISSEQLSKTSDGDVGAAVKRVTGVTIVGGKNVFVRGLGDRYSNVQVNGSSMPSTNPDKKEFPVDAFDTSVLDNIVVQKTYTADQPGEFSGGSVQIKTKDFPGSRFMSVGFGIGYNSVSTGSDILSYDGGGIDFLGYDDGTREMPSVANSGQFIGNSQYNAFSNKYTPKTMTALPSQSYSIAYANEFEVAGKPFGLVTSLTYDNDSKFYESRYAQVVTPNFNNYEYDLEKGKFSTNLSAMANVFYKLSPNFKLGMKNLYINSSDDQASEIVGDDFTAGGLTPLRYRQTQLKFVQSQVYTTSLISEIYLPEFYESKWQTDLSYSLANRYEPDTRRTITRWYEDANQQWGIVTGRDMGNSHFYSEQNDNNYNFKSSLEMKLDKSLKLKTGINVLLTQREFWARRFNIRGNQITRGGNPDVFYAEPNESLVQTNFDNNLFTFQDATAKADNYDAMKTTSAFYVSTDYLMSNELSFIIGARVEYDYTELSFEDPPTGVDPKITKSSTDLLPALNVVYKLGDESNIRAAFSKTLVRPQFREIAPFFYSDFIGSKVLNGNPELKQTDILNYDLRYEMFFGSGEMVAMSAFGKNFTNPIERIYRQTENNELFYVNAKNANLYGVELEIRKSLTDAFKVTSNLTLITSSTVEYPKTLDGSDTETNKIQANTDRPLVGQSPYTFNMSTFYEIPESNLNLSLSFNRFGKRINAVGSFLQGDDEFEEPFNQLDFTASYRYENYKFKFNVKNILNEDVIFRHNKEIVDTYSPGVTMKLSTTVEL